jgi:hypothetical protein
MKLPRRLPQKIRCSYLRLRLFVSRETIDRRYISAQVAAALRGAGRFMARSEF